MSGLNELPPPYSHPSMPPMSGPSTMAPPSTGIDERIGKVAIPVLHLRPDSVPAEVSPSSLIGRAISQRELPRDIQVLDETGKEAEARFAQAAHGEIADDFGNDGGVELKPERERQAEEKNVQILEESLSPSSTPVFTDFPITLMSEIAEQRGFLSKLAQAESPWAENQIFEETSPAILGISQTNITCLSKIINFNDETYNGQHIQILLGVNNQLLGVVSKQGPSENQSEIKKFLISKGYARNESEFKNVIFYSKDEFNNLLNSLQEFNKILEKLIAKYKSPKKELPTDDDQKHLQNHLKPQIKIASKTTSQEIIEALKKALNLNFLRQQRSLERDEQEKRITQGRIKQDDQDSKEKKESTEATIVRLNRLKKEDQKKEIEHDSYLLNAMCKAHRVFNAQKKLTTRLEQQFHHLT